MKYARASWKQERASWRAVVQLNLVRSIITIVQILQDEMDSPNDAEDRRRPSTGSSALDVDETQPLPLPLTDKHQLLKLRLGPLRRIEADLKKRLGSGTEEITSDNINADADYHANNEGRPRPTEFGVRALKDALSGPTKPEGASLDGEQQIDETTEVIVGCKDDMKALWTDEAVRAVLKKRRMRVEDSAGLLVRLFVLCTGLTVFTSVSLMTSIG
jgi:guanine nucleotide-binding protein alpha-1 subunit